ncbi:MAG: transposase [Candidatus Hydrogenedentes bacterium]|nr:transposase [Candidatus Hydrogenedentota bacterium]
MRASRLHTNEGRSIYKKRKHVVEPVFGWVKNVLGFRRTGLHGRDSVRSEWFLGCSTLNSRRMAAKATAIALPSAKRKPAATAM